MKRWILFGLLSLFCNRIWAQQLLSPPEQDIFDGPHIEFLENDRVKLNYLVYDSYTRKSREFSRKRRYVDEKPVRGAGRDKQWYNISREYDLQPAEYDNVSKVFAIGDIHGNYDRVERLLVNAGIMNEAHHWTWGDGHLVFLGDIFDRGDQVTRILWLVKNLQSEAKTKGGMVHLLYGNHELMIMQDDLRYISDNLRYLTLKLEIDYSSLFSNKFDLGRWLRNQSTMLRINSTLFVHGGISSGLLDFHLSLDSVNQRVCEYLKDPDREETDSLVPFLMGAEGPFWYRGYIPGIPGFSSYSIETLEATLSFYKAENIVYGHTTSNNFRLDFQNRLIGIDVSKSSDYEMEQALLIENKKYFKVYLDGKTIPLF